MIINRKFFVFTILVFCLTAFIFSYHVIRIDNGVEIIRKENFTYKDFYVDVRGYGLADYFYHAPKIRNYLFFDKPYKRLLSLIEKKKTELEKAKAGEEKTKGGVAQKLKPIEKAIREWIEKIFK